MRFLRIMGLGFLVARSAVFSIVLVVAAQIAASAAAHRQHLLQTGKLLGKT